MISEKVTFLGSLLSHLKNCTKSNKADKEIADLSKTIKTLLAEKPKPESEEVPEELLQLRVENTNLKSELENLQSTTAKITKAKPEKARLVFWTIFLF